jgi:hypothetical protein
MEVYYMEENMKEIKLKINDSELKGQYSNQVAIMHSKYDFVIDFIAMFPPEAIVNSRIITTPIAFKKFYAAFGINLKKYEEQYGIIEDDNNAEINGKIN